ncbi:MAG: four helix bundle protein [Muribaculaceae bacterium]|nr:four helix bundle protein [Muribaculaceae bacterium]
MKKDNDNIIVIKSKTFALRSIKLYRYMIEEEHEYVLSKQFLRSATSIGANVKEAIRGQSDADFGAKMNISLKEASETEYWLELMQESEYIPFDEGENMLAACRELIRILTAIVKTTFENNKQK